MGFWSTLGKIGMAAAPIIAAPFTAGTSLAALPGILSAGGAAIGAMGNAATQNRAAQDERAFAQDQLRLRMAQDDTATQAQRAQLQLAQRGDARDQQRQDYLNALRSALAMHAQDVSIDRGAFRSNVPTIRFGGSPRPSQIGPEGRQAAETLNRQALLSLMTPPTYEGLPSYTPPTLSTPSKAGIWEKLAGPIGFGLSAAGAFSKPPTPGGQ